MSTRIKIGLGVAALLAAAIVFGMKAYIDHVRDDADTKAKIAIQQARIDSAEKRVGEIKKDLDDKNGELETEKAKIKTAPQAQQALNKYTPLKNTEVLPQAPSAAAAAAQKSVLTLEDATKLGEFGISCRQCENARDAAQATIQQKNIEITAANKQRDDAISNAKGGGFFKRLKRNTKWLVIGIGVGAAATAATHR